MPQVNLEENEWQNVMSIIAQAPWNIANPLLMKIGAQLRDKPAHDQDGKFATGNSGGHPRKGETQEVPVPQSHLES